MKRIGPLALLALAVVISGTLSAAPQVTEKKLSFSYNTSPNVAAVQEADPAKTLVKPEVTFQLSFKAKL
jgi:hypothetical protein